MKFLHLRKKKETKPAIEEILVNKARYTGCFLCSRIAPGVLALGKDGKAEVVGPLTPEKEAQARKAIGCCPSRALQAKEADRE